MYRENPTLMTRVASYDNLIEAAEVVRKNKGAAGIDGMSVDDVEQHIHDYYGPLRRKLIDGSYRPLPVKRVEIEKENGGIRLIGIPCARDRVIQQAIRQVIEPKIDRMFYPESHGFRPNRGTKTALQDWVGHYEDGYKYVVDCDLKQCFDKLNQDKLMYLLGKRIHDRVMLKLIRKFLRSGVIDLSGEYVESKTGAPQGGVLSPLLCNIYLHELDKELYKRGHRFVRYADDFVIFVKSKRAGERVLTSITKFIEKELKLEVNTEKSKVGSPTRLKFLGCLIMQVNGVCRFRPATEKKKKFKAKLKKLTSRKRPGTYEEIMQSINEVTRGWINYFGLGFIKSFIEEKIAPWLHRRIRQLILKRWKRPRTIIKQLMKYGLDIDSAKRIAFSRKKYWRLSCTHEVHRALTTKRLHQWGLFPLNKLVKAAYGRY
ncbi:group II intron reverse transcriptase/maturase [Tuanshanicoccus lijuaniae]|nr:group II intron reverse transcriptase/maturase [Aerococcaceae bacterium zg-1292]QQA38154.1 group II intron reverse transcriptase/maturase [Aerococcaceae bacterium zg-1292]